MQNAMEADEEIIPFAIIIKHIPLHWERDRLLQIFSHMKLPLPIAMNYLYNESNIFRGMAFATFRTSYDTRRVVRELNYYPVAGRNLTVQFKKKRPETTAKGNPYRKETFQPVLSPHLEAKEEANDHISEDPHKRAHSAPRRTRQQTPPSESYDLLMSYQTDPVEKAKLKGFLAQTGDYQKAVNEFSKNRAREVQGLRYLAQTEVYPDAQSSFADKGAQKLDDRAFGRDADSKPILESRRATEEDLERIAAMEGRFDARGQAAAPWGSLAIKS